MSKESGNSSNFPKIIPFLIICVLLTTTFYILKYVDFKPGHIQSSYKYINNKIGEAKNFLLEDSSKIIPEFDDPNLAFQVLQQLDIYL